MDSTYIIIAVGVLVAIIAAVAVYYFFFTETEKQKDAREYVNKLQILKEEKKPFSEFLEIRTAFEKKYPKIAEKMKSKNEFSDKFEELMSKNERAEVVKLLVSEM